MKFNNRVLLLFSFLFASGCSEQLRVRSDYDKDVNLKLYKTYAWLPVKEIESKVDPLVFNELTNKRIKSAVDLQLKSKLIKYTADSPDLRVHYHIVIDNKSMMLPARYGYNYSQYWIRNQTDVYYYREGTLIIDLMDAKSNNLVWRGWGIRTVDNSDIDLTEQEINDAVDKIMKAFPPTKK
jgi:hypothetical protein